MAQPQSSPFTFMEVMVYAVLALITLLLVTRFVAQVESESERNLRIAREDILWFSSALGAYSFDTGKPIPTSAEGGLSTLITSGYLSDIPLDPYERPYHYVAPGKYSGKAFEIHSLGPDGVESEDDIVSWDLYGTRLLW